jgi:hypothetical protein
MRAGTGPGLPNILTTKKNDKFQVNALRGLSEVSLNLTTIAGPIARNPATDGHHDC